MLHASETWPLTKTNLQPNESAMIRQICSTKPEDVATGRSSELLTKLEDHDLILREKASHVVHSSSAVRTACDIQNEGRRGKYFNIVDLCGVLLYKRMCPHLCGRIIYNCISSPFLYYNQYAWVQLSFVMISYIGQGSLFFSWLMSANSISKWKCKRLSNMDHILGSYAVKLPNNYWSFFEDVSIDRHL